MADNVNVTAGSGTTIAADEVTDGTLGTVKVQYVKLMDGTLDSTTKIGGSNGLPIGDGTTSASVFPATFLRTSDEPRQVFYDPFDAAVDTTNRWTSTSGSSGVAASTTTGQMSLGTGTTANGYAKLVSQPSFTPSVPAWLGFSSAITIPDLAAPTANSFRFWGAGTTPGTPSVATPLTDAIGFEITTAGKMFAVVYAGGTRTAIQDLSAATGNSKQPTDANQHRYAVYVRTDKAYFYIDGINAASLVATSNFQAPQIQTLPTLMLAIGNSTPPVTNSQIQCNGTAVWDTGKNATQIADGAFPWRKQTVKAASTAAAAADLPAVVALHPTSPLPAGTSTIGAVTSAEVTTSGSLGVLNATVASVTTGATAAIFNFTAGLVGNVKFQGLVDNVSTWVDISYHTVNAVGVFSATLINTAFTPGANLTYIVPNMGLGQIRVICSSYTSGSTTATARSTSVALPSGVYIDPTADAQLSGLTRALPATAAAMYLYDSGPSSHERQRAVTNATNSTGTGIAAVGMLAQLDDATPTTITENQFGNVRMTANRGLHAAPKTDTVGGATPFNLISAASTNATAVKAAAGTLYSISAYNNGASAAYLKIFNKATAPTVGTDIAVMIIYLPAAGGSNVVLPPMGVALSTGLSYCITGLGTTADTTAVAAAQVFVNGSYA